MKNKEREYFGLTLVISACIMAIIFIATCIKKKSLLAALSALATLNLVGGYYLLRRAKKKNNGYAFDFFDEDKYEIFSEEEAKAAVHAIHAGFHKRRRADNAGKHAKAIYVIPVDDEATEEDFIR